MELCPNFCIKVFGKKNGLWEWFKILHRNKIELIQYREMFLQYIYLAELNNKKNTTASTEIILGYRNVAAEINFRISLKQFNFFLQYKILHKYFRRKQNVSAERNFKKSQIENWFSVCQRNFWWNANFYERSMAQN